MPLVHIHTRKPEKCRNLIRVQINDNEVFIQTKLTVGSLLVDMNEILMRGYDEEGEKYRIKLHRDIKGFKRLSKYLEKHLDLNRIWLRGVFTYDDALVHYNEPRIRFFYDDKPVCNLGKN